MEKEMEERPKKRKRRRKRSRFGYYLYALVVLILTIANIALASLILFHVQKIEISGNKYSETNDILKWVKEDPYTSNSLYAVTKFKTGSYELPVYLEKVKVGLGAPWQLNVKVEEKKIIGCILVGHRYAYFDKDGLVLTMQAEGIEGIPVIEGLDVKNVVQYEKLSVQNKEVFSYIVDMTKQVEESKLNPDRILWEGDSMNLRFGGICVQFGTTRFEEKMQQLPPILEELEGKKGTLHLEHYSKTNTNISFEQDGKQAE